MHSGLVCICLFECPVGCLSVRLVLFDVYWCCFTIDCYLVNVCCLGLLLRVWVTAFSLIWWYGLHGWILF